MLSWCLWTMFWYSWSLMAPTILTLPLLRDSPEFQGEGPSRDDQFRSFLQLMFGCESLHLLPSTSGRNFSDDDCTRNWSWKSLYCFISTLNLCVAQPPVSSHPAVTSKGLHLCHGPQIGPVIGSVLPLFCPSIAPAHLASVAPAHLASGIDCTSNVFFQCCLEVAWLYKMANSGSCIFHY